MSGNRHPGYYPYIYSVAASGFIACLLSIPALIAGQGSNYWILLAFLTLLTSAFPIKIPEIDYKVSIEDTFFFTNLILFGTEAGVITAGLQGFMGSVRAKSNSRRLEFALFNMGALMLSAFISGHAFFHALGRGPLYGGAPVSYRDVAIPIGVLALVHYASNSLSVAVVIALDVRQNIYNIWKKNFRWTSVTYLTGATVASLIALNLRSFNLAVLGAAAPIVLFTSFTFKVYKDKIVGHLGQIEELNSLYLRTVESLALAVDAKDQTTHGHIRRVRAYSVGLARLNGINDKNELLAVETGALLHDIGKLAVEDYILNKPGRLSAQEFEKVKKHTVAGEEILKQIRFPFPVAQYVRAHHERWDGSGYPDGLKETAIPLGARILSIADTYDALRTSRPYKASRGSAEAAEILQEESGASYDPQLLELFLNNIEQLELAADEAAKGMPELQFRKAEPAAPVHEKSGPLVPIAPSNDAMPELVSLYEFCAVLGRNLCLDDALMNLACRIKRLVPYHTAAFFIADADNFLRAAHVSGKFADILKNFQMPFGKGVSGWTAAYQRPMMNTKPLLDFQGLQGDFSKLADTLAVPLMHEEKCLGVISLYAEEPIRYSDAHLSVMRVVAKQAAPLISEVMKQPSLASEKALVDELTGTYNVRYLAVAGARLIETCSEHGLHFHLIKMELTNLPSLAETDGPDACNRILRAVGKALNSEIRETDILARCFQSGFALMIAGAKQEKIQRRMKQFEELISTIRMHDGRSLSCKLGAAKFPADGTSVFTLLEAAQEHILGQTGEAADIRKTSVGNVVGFPHALSS